MIKIGQLRQWNQETFELIDDGNLPSKVFVVIKNSGKFFKNGFAPKKMESHWDVLMSDGIIGPRWPASQLEILSDVIR